MEYPKREAVNAAGPAELQEWYEKLPTPGTNYIGKRNYPEKLREEQAILKLIVDKVLEG